MVFLLLKIGFDFIFFTGGDTHIFQ